MEAKAVWGGGRILTPTQERMIFERTKACSLPRVVCGWCQAEIRPGIPPTSHGMCERCKARFEAGEGK